MFDSDTIEINGQSFRASDIQDVRLVEHPPPTSNNYRRVLAAVNSIVILTLGTLKLSGMVAGQAEFVVSLLFTIGLGLNVWFIYTGVILRGGNNGTNANDKRTELAIEINIGNRYIEVLRSIDVPHVQKTATQLRHFLGFSSETSNDANSNKL